MDFRDVSLIDLADDVRSGRRSARDLTEASLARIANDDGELNSFVYVDERGARAQADEIDARVRAHDSVGPLAGIPLGVKDLEDVAGMPTRYGSALTSDDPAEEDSVLVARLRAAGCVVIGKTATPEYGHKGKTDSPHHGVTKNPWNTAYSPAGSSGGTAAALAAGLVPLGTGSDGGGSIRLPASVTGLSAIKTTQGRVPNGGANPPGSLLASVKGPMTRTTAELAYSLDCVVGPHPTDAFSLPRTGASWYEAVMQARLPQRVVWSPTLGFADVDSEMAQRCEAAMQQLQDAGVEVVEMDDIWATSPLEPWLTMWTASRARAQEHLIGTDAFDQIDPTLQALILMGTKVTGVQMALAIDAIHHYNLALQRVFEQAPLLVTPVTAGLAAPLVGDGTVNGVATPKWVDFTFGFNLTRNPAGTVSIGCASNGVPVGIQIVGRNLDDVGVLQAMAAMESVFGVAKAPFG